MKKTLILLLFFVGSLSLFAQGPPPCGTNAAPGNTCPIATSICNLNGYCGQTSGSYTADYWSQLNSQFCGSIENNSFLSFVANSTSIAFDVWIYSCSYNDGIQIMIYGSSGACSGSVTSYYCGQQMYPTGNGASSTPYNVTANGLVVGETYYIMIDGFAGDICNYTFSASGGVATDIGTDDGTGPPNPTGSSYKVCPGESITVNATGGSGTVYTWTGQGLSATTGSSVTITPPSTPGTYNYTIETNGATSLGCPDVKNYSFQIDVAPIANLTASAVCATGVGTTVSGSFSLNTTVNTGTMTVSSSCGGSQTFNAPFYSGSSSLTYNYSFPGGTGDGENCTVTVSMSDSPGCTATQTFVEPNCCVTPTAPAITTTPASCSAAGTSTITDYDPNYTYTFTPSGPTIGAGGIINGATFGTSYQVIAVNQACSSPASTFQNDAQYNMPNVNLTASSTTICDGETITLTATGATTYSWDNGLGAGDTHTLSPTATATYNVTGSTPEGCTDAASVTVTVSNNNSAIFTTIPDSICQGTNMTMPNVSTNGVTGSWSPPFDNNNTTTYTFTPDPGQCTNDTTATINVKPSPVVSAQVTNTAICTGDTIDINIVTNPSGAAIQWTATNNNTTGATSGTGTKIKDYIELVNGNMGGTITYEITATKDGCTNNPLTIINYTVGQPLGTSSTLTTSSTTVLEGETTNLNVTMTPYIPGVLYSWSPTESLSCNDCPNPIATPTESTCYTVMLISTDSSNICPLIDSVCVNFKMNCGETFVPSIFSPNQDGENDIFKVYGRCLVKMQMFIYDRWGALIFQTDDAAEGWDGTYKGKLMNSGTFVYRIHVTNLYGDVEEFSGNVTLVR